MNKVSSKNKDFKAHHSSINQKSYKYKAHLHGFRGQVTKDDFL